jgi:hypothetical protein
MITTLVFRMPHLVAFFQENTLKEHLVAQTNKSHEASTKTEAISDIVSLMEKRNSYH